MLPKIEVVNTYHGYAKDPANGNFYIGRGSPLGNPYKVSDLGRGNCIEPYRGWLAQQIQAKTPSVIAYLNEVAKASVQRQDGVRLVCFCKPRACHGDVIKEVIEARFKEMRNGT